MWKVKAVDQVLGISKVPTLTVWLAPRLPRCRGIIKTWTMASRTVYACEVCQPLLPNTETVGTPDKVKLPVQEFNSHCAEDDSASLLLTPMKMTVAALVKELKGRGLPVRGG